MTDPLDPSDYPVDVVSLDEILAYEARLSDARAERGIKDYRMHHLSLDDRTNHTALELRAVREDAREADFVCSTGAIDSHGTRLEQSEWNLSRFLANPVVLFAHNSRELPIGQAKNVRVENGKLLATVRFSDVHARACEVFALVKEGTLRGISVGFRFGDYCEEKAANGGDSVIVLKDLELIELSITPTPSNPECVTKIRSTGTQSAPILPKPPARQTEEEALRFFNDSLLTPADREAKVWIDRCVAEERANQAAWAVPTSTPIEARAHADALHKHEADAAALFFAEVVK